MAASLAIPRPLDLRSVLERFASEDARIARTYRTILRRAVHPATSDAEVATQIEAEVIGPWRAARSRLAEHPARTPRERELVEAVMRYADMREKGWASSVVALRSNDRAALADADEHEANAETLLDYLKHGDKRAPR
jgi:hypothetical protein